jgi:hypothetical protein
MARFSVVQESLAPGDAGVLALANRIERFTQVLHDMKLVE